MTPPCALDIAICDISSPSESGCQPELQRFALDFIFRLSVAETASLKSQSVTSLPAAPPLTFDALCEGCKVRKPLSEGAGRASRLWQSPLFVDEDHRAFTLSPKALGGTMIRISLIVDDPDALAQRALAAGAREVFPIAVHSYGLRQGRVEDPYGHHWLIEKPLGR